jgi:hypothetical protein
MSQPTKSFQVIWLFRLYRNGQLSNIQSERQKDILRLSVYLGLEVGQTEMGG